MKTTHFLLNISVFCLAFILSLPVYGTSELHVNGGGFFLTSKTSTTTSSLSNIGLLQFAYQHGLWKQSEFLIGYHLQFPQYAISDFAYGLQLGVHIFPFTQESKVIHSENNMMVQSEERFRPFFGFMITQKQFQSIRSNYLGAGLSIGNEFSFQETLGIEAKANYTYYFGPMQSRLQELTATIGLIFHF